MAVKELRDELRTLRKESVKPISKMRLNDISAEIERLRVSREETPPVASTISGKSKKVVESVKEAVITDVKTPDVVQKVKVKSIDTATLTKKKEKKVQPVTSVVKPKKVLSPEHKAKMMAGRMAKKVAK